MPKARRPNPYDKLTALIAGAKAVQHMTMDDVSASTGISRSRLFDRKNSPQDYTLNELGSIARALRISREQLLEAMPW